MKHYVAISYLSKFTRMEVKEYSNKLTEQDKKIYAILTNEAGIQGILDCIKEESDDYTIDVLYLQSKEVVNTKGKRKKFDEFYKSYQQGVIKLDSYINALKEDVPPRTEEEIKQEEMKQSETEDFHESEYFERRVKHFAKIRNLKEPKIIPIEVSENVDMVSANKNQLQGFINAMQELTDNYNAKKEDFHIYLDSTGGPRDFSFLCIMLIKLLQFEEYNVEKVIYSNINSGEENEVGSIDNCYEMLGIINGVSEFINYGRVATLKSSLGRNTESENEDSVDRLLESMERYSNMLSICDFNSLKETYKLINDKMEKVKNDLKNNEFDSRVAIMAMQFPHIIEQMGISDPRQHFLKLFENYKKNDMIQQAVTFYNEKMPEYIMENLQLIQIDDLVVESNNVSPRNRIEALLHGLEVYNCYKAIHEERHNRIYKCDRQEIHSNEFIIEIRDFAEKIWSKRVPRCENLYRSKLYNAFLEIEEYGKYAETVYILSNIDNFPNIKFPKGNKEQVITLLKDYLVIREIRNHMNHASDDPLMESQKAQEYFCFMHEPQPSLYDHIKAFLENAYKHLSKLQPQPDSSTTSQPQEVTN